MEWVALAVVGAAAVAWALYRLVGSPAPVGGSETRRDVTRRAASIQVEEDDFPVLLGMLLGDRSKAERLVAYEGRLAPGAGRARLIENAIDRLRHDLNR